VREGLARPKWSSPIYDQTLSVWMHLSVEHSSQGNTACQWFKRGH
jgi:hypothetical protein